MCLLSEFDPGLWVDDQALLRGAQVNDEGFGFAVATPGELYTWKDTCGPLEAVARFLRLREAFPDSYAVFHSRLSTGSAVTRDNCHPFPVAGDDRTVVFHNGSLPYGEWALSDGATDTAIFAQETFPQLFSDLDDPVTFGMLEQWATPANKLVILTANPRYEKSCYIVNRREFIADREGALHSNPDFCGPVPAGAGQVGWAEETDAAGDLWRWNEPGRTRLRNETERRRKVAAASAGRVTTVISG